MAEFWGIILTSTEGHYDSKPGDANGEARRRRHKSVHGIGLATGKSHGPIMIDVQHLRWQLQAACRDMDRELFFEDDPSPEARAACAACPVRQLCDDYAAHHRLVGLWGGHTFDERRRKHSRDRSRARRADTVVAG